MDRLVGSSSPYVSSIVYDINERTLVLELVDHPDKMNLCRRITFTDILSYQEENMEEEPEDECMDDIVGIDYIQGGICIHTYKKEVVLKLESEPRAEYIA